jgi:hypothetical protein
MAAKRTEDGGGEAGFGRSLNKGVRSETYNRLKYQAETIAKDTLFSNVASLDVIQGLSKYE